ncbi:unnamed protein product [Ascophyllum nodosum]
MADEEGDGSALGSQRRNSRSVLAVNSLHDALEEAEKQRDELADKLIKRQAELPIFADDADADDSSQDSHRRRDAATAPSHDGDRIGDSSARCGSSGDGLRRRGRGALRLLRNSLLATLPPPSLQPPVPPQSALTRTRIRKPERSHGDERAAEPRIGGEGDRSRIGEEDRMRPPPPRARVGSTAEARGTRRGGQKNDAGGGGGLSTASVGPVGGMLRGGELERVRGRVKDLGTAIEMSQSKLLQELSQVQEDFLSSFSYTPQLGTSGGGAVSRSDPTFGCPSRWGLPPSRDRSPLRRRDLEMREGPALVTHRPGNAASRKARNDGDRGGLGSGATFSSGRTGGGSDGAFVTWDSKKSTPQRWRSLSPSMLGSRASGASFSKDAGQEWRSSVSKPDANELQARLLTELVKKEALATELEDSRRKAEEYLTKQEEAGRELDHLRAACRSAQEKAKALERSLSALRDNSENRGALLEEAAGKTQELETDRDRTAQEYESFRRKVAERAASQWLRERTRASLRAATGRWREAALWKTRLKSLATGLDSWRARRALARWRLEARVSKSARGLSIQGGGQVLRRRSVRCLRRWALAALRKKRLRRLLRARISVTLLRAWFQWRSSTAVIAARSQKMSIDRTEEYESFRRKVAERAASQWLRERTRASLRAAIGRWREAALRKTRLKGLEKGLDSWRARRALVRWRLEARVSKSARGLSTQGGGRVLRRRSVRCLRRWALAALRKKRLRRLLRARVSVTLTRAWFQWRSSAALIAARSQKMSIDRMEELVRAANTKVGFLEDQLEQKKELVRAADTKVGSLEDQLEQKKAQAERGYDRVAAVRSKSLQRASRRRTAHAAFSAWVTYSRRRARARGLVSRLLNRRRKIALAEGFRRLSAEAENALCLERVLTRYQAFRKSRATALGWSCLVKGVERCKQQKQALEMLLVRKSVQAAFERLRQRAEARKAARAVLERICGSYETRMRIAFRRWTRRTTASAAAASALSRLARRCYSRAAREGLLRWRRAATQARTEGLQDRLTEAKALAARGTGNARRTAAVVLLGALRRSRRQSLRWGFGMLEERRLDKERKLQALKRLSCSHRRRERDLLSIALTRWRRRIASRALTTTGARRLAGIARRLELRGAIQRWGQAVDVERAVEGLAGRVERVVKRVFLTRGWQRWRAECRQRQDVEAREREEKRRSALCGRLQAGSRRALLLRCLMEWRVQTVIRRCQLGSARSLLLSQDGRRLRKAFSAWREGRRGRVVTARALFRAARSIETATLRAGFRRLAVSTRRKDQEEVVTILAAARLEADQALRDRDAMSARLVEVEEKARCAVKERAFADCSAEEERALAKRSVTISDCFSAWKALAHSQRRRTACAQRLLNRLRRGSLRRALACWRDGARESASLALVERLLARNDKRETQSRHLRAWFDCTRRHRRAKDVLLRTTRVLSSLEKWRTRRAFGVWRAAADARSRWAVNISGACARLRAVRVLAGRSQLVSAFSLWARLSKTAAQAENLAETAAEARRRRVLLACLVALSRNAVTRRLGHRAVVSLGRTLRLRRLARGWGAMVGAAAATVAVSDTRARLEAVEARVAEGREAARARAHRTARRLLGVARGRTALEAFVAWKAYVRQGRGARLGGRALAARSRRRVLRDALVRWREQSLASSRLRARTLARLSAVAEGLVTQAFQRWRERSRVDRVKKAATVALSGVYERRRSERAGKILALRTWRQNVCVEEFDSSGSGVKVVSEVGGVEASEEWDSGALEVLARVAQEATAAFSFASSVARVFSLVEQFIAIAVPLSRGHLLLLPGKPGGDMFSLEYDRTVKPEQDAVEVFFPIGDGLVRRCVSTGLPCQAVGGDGGGGYGDGSRLSSRRALKNNAVVALSGPADLYGLLPPGRHHHHCPEVTLSAAGTLTFSTDTSTSTGSRLAPGPDSASTMHCTPGSVAAVPADARGRRRRLAFFPADDDDSRSPSPARASPRSQGLPKRRECTSPQASAGASGVGTRAESTNGAAGLGRETVFAGREQPLSYVACVPVVERGGGRSMIGVLKAWRWRGDERDPRKLARFSSPFASGEMAALGVVAGHAAAAVRRLNHEPIQKQGEDDSASEKKRETAAMKEEVDSLREAMGQLSRSARGLVRQRDDARAQLARAKGTLRRMVPALREVRDRQLGFRHYHDLIVNMSRRVLQEDPDETSVSLTPPLVGHSRHLRGRGGSGDGSSSNGGGGGKRPDSRGSSRRASPGRSPSPTVVTGDTGAAGAQRKRGNIHGAPTFLPRHPDDQAFALTVSGNGHRGVGVGGVKGGPSILNALRMTAGGGGRGQKDGSSRSHERNRA